jgi:hypothetical protein
MKRGSPHLPVGAFRGVWHLERAVDLVKRVPSRLASLGRRLAPSSRPTGLTRAFGPPTGLRA